MTEFKLSAPDAPRTITAKCEWKKTQTAFKHVATLLIDGREWDKTKICYLNRTWERYTYESVLYKLVEKKDSPLTKEEKETARGAIEHYQEPNPFGFLAAIAKMGEILAPDQKGANDWKARMLKAGLEGRGLIMPEGWDSLTEDEKERRLNGVIGAIA